MIGVPPRCSGPGTARSLLVLLGAVLLLVTACSGAETEEKPDPDPGGAPADIADTSYGQLFQARVDGEMDELTLALTEFSLAFGEVSGGMELAADGSGPASGTGAYEAVLSVWDDLTSEQQQAVDDRIEAWLGGGAGASDDAAATGQSVGVAQVAAYAPSADEAQVAELATAAAEYVEGHLGGWSLDYELTFVGESLGDGRFAETLARPTANRTCEIALGPEIVERDEALIQATLAHEFFHCWSWVQNETREWTPRWYEEGLASWVGETYAGGTTLSRSWWAAYFHPEMFPLRRISYSAIGFWSWVADAPGTDLWAAIPELHRLAIGGDEMALYEAAIALVPDDVRELGSARFRVASWGKAWDMDGPGIGGSYGNTREVAPGDTVTLEPGDAEWASAYLAFPPSDPDDPLTVTFQGTGPHFLARWTDGNSLSGAGGPKDAKWCLEFTCECPDGTAPPGFEPLTPGQDLTLAVTGEPGTADTISISVGLLCAEEEEEPEEPPDTASGEGELEGTWRATDAALDRMFQRFFDANDMDGFVAADGDVFLGFASGEAVLTYSDVVVVTESAGARVPVGVNGGGKFNVTIDGTVMEFDSQEYSLVFEIPGGAMTIDEGALGTGSTSEAVWGIDNDVLGIQMRDDLTPLPNRWEKVE